MPSNVILVTCGIPAKDLLQSNSDDKSALHPQVGGQQEEEEEEDDDDDDGEDEEKKTYIRAFVSALSVFCLLTMEIISGASFPESFSLATCVAANVPNAASVAASASFFCIS